jgi:hypothetical protein
MLTEDLAVYRAVRRSVSYTGAPADAKGNLDVADETMAANDHFPASLGPCAS